MTKIQLQKFIKLRNASEYTSNMQFQSDASEAGFKASELADPTRLDQKHDGVDRPGVFKWTTPHGELYEDQRLGCGKMALWKGAKFVYGDTRVGPPRDDKGPPELSKLLKF